MDGDLVAHPKQELEDEPGSADSFRVFENKHPLPEPKWVVTPSLATLERAVSAREPLNFLCLVIATHSLGGNDGWLWKGIF